MKEQREGRWREGGQGRGKYPSESSAISIHEGFLRLNTEAVSS